MQLPLLSRIAGLVQLHNPNGSRNRRRWAFASLDTSPHPSGHQRYNIALLLPVIVAVLVEAAGPRGARSVIPTLPYVHPITYVPQVPGADAAVGVDGKPASLLTFAGARQVHGLYNWLLDSQGGEACDVPQLLAPEPFLGACLHRTEPQVHTWSRSFLHCLTFSHQAAASCFHCVGRPAEKGNSEQRRAISVHVLCCTILRNVRSRGHKSLLSLPLGLHSHFSLSHGTVVFEDLANSFCLQSVQ